MPVKGTAVVIGGGTVQHVRPHLALSAPSYGKAANIITSHLSDLGWNSIRTFKTRMAGGSVSLDTNEDVERLLGEIIQDKTVKLLVMSAALVDFHGEVIKKPGSASVEGARLQTEEGDQVLYLTPSVKLISKLRKERKDIFLVGFKATSGATREEQFLAGLKLIKKSSCNLVLANDVETRNNMVITPEEAIYGETTERQAALRSVAKIATYRANLTFTRSTVVDGTPVAWNAPEVPDSLRQVVNHCVQAGAYKPFLGSTVGHFAAKLDEHSFLTSIRRSNFNKLGETGLVYVEAEGTDKVTAFGAKPSVGGQSQRIIFREHPSLNCIVHAHCPLKAHPADLIPVRKQYLYECGSHECGKNTSDALKDFGGFKAVMLDQHGFNIVFGRDTDPNKLISFISANWDLDKSTNGIFHTGVIR